MTKERYIAFNIFGEMIEISKERFKKPKASNAIVGFDKFGNKIDIIPLTDRRKIV